MSNIAFHRTYTFSLWLEVDLGEENSMKKMFWNLQYFSFSDMAANNNLKAEGETYEAEIDLN